jgi:SHS2 domain-containing protein
MKYKFLNHTADAKFQANGKTIEECFLNSAYALKELMIGDTKVKNIIQKDILIKAKNKEALLYSFLEEFLFLLDAEKFIFSDIKKIKISKKKEYELKAMIYGDESINYKFSNSVKAITYNEMIIKKEKNIWIAKVVLDL